MMRIFDISLAYHNHCGGARLLFGVLSDVQKLEIAQMIEAGSTIGQIGRFLALRYQVSWEKKHLKNFMDSYKRERKQPLPVMMKELRAIETPGFIFDPAVNGNGALLGVFSQVPEGEMIRNRWGHVGVVDVTYQKAA